MCSDKVFFSGITNYCVTYSSQLLGNVKFRYKNMRIFIHQWHLNMYRNILDLSFFCNRSGYIQDYTFCLFDIKTYLYLLYLSLSLSLLEKKSIKKSWCFFTAILVWPHVLHHEASLVFLPVFYFSGFFFSTHAHCNVLIGWFLLTNIKECLICGTQWFMCVCVCVCVCVRVLVFVFADHVISIQYCSTHKK